MLEKAQYFLHQMIATVDNQKYFLFNLDAFASAGRSVTFVMRSAYKIKEDSDTPRWRWYKENVIDALDNEEIPKFFKEYRNMSVKENKSPIDIFTVIIKDVVFKYNINGEANEKEDEGLEEQGSDDNEEPSEKAAPKTTTTKNPAAQEDPTVKKVWYFPENTRRYVIKSCEQYFLRLSGLVEECEGKFG